MPYNHRLPPLHRRLPGSGHALRPFQVAAVSADNLERARQVGAQVRQTLAEVAVPDEIAGRAFYEGVRGGADAAQEDEHTLVGSPVSPAGVVHVVFNPHETQLAPGEILVCPGTDLAWTPLFLAAGGLVMEVGGLMTHGSVVAREYGIPAVVGVHEATSRLHNGQRIRVDGSRGTVEVLRDDVECW